MNLLKNFHFEVLNLICQDYKIFKILCANLEKTYDSIFKFIYYSYLEIKLYITKLR